MKSFLKLLHKRPGFILIIFLLGTAPACNNYKCPANGGGYVDKPKVAKKTNRHKPKSGLWGKEMRR